MKAISPRPAKTAKAKPPKRAAGASGPHGAPLVDNVAMTREMFDYFKKHRDEGRQLLARTGIYTKAGKLTKAYGG